MGILGVTRKCDTCRESQRECEECQSGSESVGALHSCNSRATKKMRIESTEMELTKLRVDHGLLFQEHETLG